MIHISRIRLVFVGLALLVFSSNSYSVAFTDESMWRSAVGSFLLEDFDAIPAGSSIPELPSLGIRFGMLNDGTFPTIQSYNNTGGTRKSNPHNLLNDADFALPARGPYTIFPLNPSESIFGLGLWNVGNDDTLKLSFFDESDMLIEEVVSPAAFGFFGIFNATGAKKVVIDPVAGNGYMPVDDLQIAGTSIVPIPAAVWLFGSAFLALTGYSRRNTRITNK
ncbi:MAG: hypothetical protein AAF512_25865 [Pseudomonadota bacterium]